MARAEQIYDVAIVGGGFSGTLLSVQLLKKSSGKIAIAVINRSDRQGRGVAYETECQSHLLNVAAEKMSAIPEQPDHFVSWLSWKYGISVDPGHFAPRGLYGDYLEYVLKLTLQEYPAAIFRWIPDDACSLEIKAARPFLRLRTGAPVQAEIVVLATGNALPCDPPQLEKISSKFYVSNAWSRGVLESIPRSGTVLLAGSGLTAIDQVLALRARNFEGQIFMLSRHGKTPAPHTNSSQWPSTWAFSLPNNISSIVGAIHEQVRLAEKLGVDWRSVIDSMRPATPALWSNLSPAERKRFLRHLRSLWEVVRHRVPIEIYSKLKDQIDSGTLRVFAGRFVEIIERDQQIEVKIRLRGRTEEQILVVDRIINCTGPSTSLGSFDDLFRELVKTGLARIDPVGIGIETASDGSVIDRSGVASKNIYALGPVRKATSWETTAVPEIRAQIEQLTKLLIELSHKSTLQSI